MTNEIRTADGRTAIAGDRVFDYYGGHWGTIGEDIDEEGWFTHIRDAGGSSCLNGERVAIVVPPTNPFYATWKAGAR